MFVAISFAITRCERKEIEALLRGEENRCQQTNNESGIGATSDNWSAVCFQRVFHCHAERDRKEDEIRSVRTNENQSRFCYQEVHKQ